MTNESSWTFNVVEFGAILQFRVLFRGKFLQSFTVNMRTGEWLDRS